MSNSDNNESFKLIKLGDINGFIELAVLPKLVTAHDFFNSNHVLVFGERGHHVDKLLEWVKANRSWVEINLDTGDMVGADPEIGLFKDLHKRGVIDHAEEFHRILSAYSCGVKEAKGKATDLLIVRGFLTMPEERGISFARALRRIAEQCSGKSAMKFLGLCSNYAPFSDSSLCSGYGAFCQPYRLANLDGYEIARQKGFDLNPNDLQDAKTVDRILDHTGGQPLLVNQLALRLKTSRPHSQRLNGRDVEDGMRRLRASPPNICETWKDRLRNILTANPGLINTMKSYVRGETLAPFRFPPPGEELELHLAGWVGLNSEGHWGITSRFHIYLAGQVLSNF